MSRMKFVFALVILVVVIFGHNALAQSVTNVITVKAGQGMGVKITWGPPAALAQTYDKAYTRSQATDSGKAWIQFDLSNAWQTYGQGNLVSATLTLWGENGTGRSFDPAGLADSAGLEDWSMNTLTWSNAPANNVADGFSFDWSKVYGGAALWLGRSGGVDLARPDLGISFDQCARYTSTNISAFLATDTDGKVTFMWWGSNNQNWWVGTNGTYANDLANGYTSTNAATFGQLIRDTPTLTLTFVGPAAPPSGPVFTNILRVGNSIILQGSNGVAQGAYQMLGSANLEQSIGNWLGLGICAYDANGNFNFTNNPMNEAAYFYRILNLSTGPVYPPVITNSPQNLAIAVGQNAVFNVTATGTAPLIYRWYYNTNSLLAGASDATLTINGTQMADAGRYSVTVSNLLGVAASSFATLTVTGIPPVITQHPADVGVAVGQSAFFNSTATGTAPLRYQWYFNTNTVLMGQTNSSLTLNNAQLTNSGKYSVTVTNLYGSANSLFASLSVTGAVPVITAQPASLTLGGDQTANFSITATGATPLFYQWYFNTNTALMDETNSTLTVSGVTTNLAGKYSVTVSNLFGATNSAFATLTVTNARLAFPEAEGYGKYTSGGRGGAVYEVTNLNDSGAGSLRAAIAASGARTVVFRVGGTIFLNSNLQINNPDITIAGQTAPGGGICIANYPLTIAANNVIIRYIRTRLGDLSGVVNDASGGRFTTNLIVDHVSASWSIDECMSIYHCDHMTVQWCLIAESLYNSYHFVDGTTNQYGAHGFGGIWGSDYSTYHHNLLADHSSRNPRFASGCGHTDYRNNVIYNWGYNSCYGGEQQQPGDPGHSFTLINMVANYYKPGPATQPGSCTYRIANPSYRTVTTDYGQWYVSSNIMVGNATVTADNWNGGIQPQGGSGDIPLLKLDQPWPAMPIAQQTAAEAYSNVLDKVGAILPQRDSEDARLIQETRFGTNTYQGIYSLSNSVPDQTKICGIIDSQADVGGWPVLASGTPPTDSDHDGMPDAWEIAHGLNPNSSADRNNYTLSPDYTNLEVYLNELGAF